MTINKNIFYTNYNEYSIAAKNQLVLNTALVGGSNNFNLLHGNKNITIPSLAFPSSSNLSTAITASYSGSIDANFILDNITQSSGGISLYKAEIDYGDNTSDILYSKFLSSGELKLNDFSHRYSSFDGNVSSSGSLKFYYENGFTSTVNLILFKIVTDMNSFNLKTINSQKTNSDNFICNLVDKNNTIYNFIDISDKSSTRSPSYPGY